MKNDPKILPEKIVELRSKRKNGSLRVQVVNDEPSLTKQAFAEETDINYIMSKFANTGQLPTMIEREPRYGDFTDAPTFENSMAIVVKAQEQFDALPAKVRERFNNDPAKFLEFASDSDNQKELIKMGLATERQTPAPETTLKDVVDVLKSNMGPSDEDPIKPLPKGKKP
jgi:phage internal scaffolding protein